MTKLGNSAKPTRAEWWGANVSNQHHHALTLPAGGPWKITRLGCWASGKDASVYAKLALWSAGGSLLATTAQQTWAGHPYDWSQGGWDNHEGDLTSPYEVAGGTTVLVGWAREETQAEQLGLYNAGGGHYDKDVGASWPGSASGATYHTTYGDLSAYLYYELANQTPGAPTNVKLDGYASGSTIPRDGSNQYLLTATGNDPGDVMASYDYEIDTTSGNGVSPDWVSPPFSGTDVTNGITGQSISSTRTHAFTPGQWYGLRLRTTDDGGLTGAWSATYYFRINQPPTISNRVPGAAALAYIHNLATDLQVWTAAGAFAKPRFTFTYNDPESQQSSKYRVRIYNAASGSEGDASQVWDSGEVALVVASGATITVDANFAIVAGTERWWTVKACDSQGEWGAESARTAFKMRFAQGIYEYLSSGGTGWAFANSAPVNGRAAFLFASATGPSGAGRSAWVTTIGSLVPADYLNVLVRLSNTAAANNVTLPDMTFTYYGSATTPDRWKVVGGASIVLDFSSNRRYGSQSLKVTTAASTSYVQPFLYPIDPGTGNPVEAPIPVIAGVTYTYSIFVKATGLTTGVRLAVYEQGTDNPLVDANGQTCRGDLTTDTSAYADGWQRLRLTFKVPGGTAFVRPVIEYAGATSGEVFWLDAAQMEEGEVASQWRPGMVGDATVIDSNGVQIDGYAGGILRLRGFHGGTRDRVDLSSYGLLFGGDTEVSSGSAGHLDVKGPAGAQTAVAITSPAGQSGAVTLAVAGDTNLRSVLWGDATNQAIEFGPGNAARDASLLRYAVKGLKLNDAAGGNLNAVLFDSLLVQLNGRLRIGGQAAIQSLTGSVNDWNPTGFGSSTWIRIDSNGAYNITGMAGNTLGAVTGDLVLLTNQSQYTLTLVHESTSSTQYNRFFCPGAANYAIPKYGSVWVAYNNYVGRWMVIA